METKYTPGPWTVEHAIGEHQCRTTIGANKCALSYKVVADIPNSRTCEFDARLIAAAPEMLEALKDFVNAEENYRENVIANDPNAYNDPLADAYEKARAALAKAEGN